MKRPVRMALHGRVTWNIIGLVRPVLVSHAVFPELRKVGRKATMGSLNAGGEITP